MAATAWLFSDPREITGGPRDVPANRYSRTACVPVLGVAAFLIPAVLFLPQDRPPELVAAVSGVLTATGLYATAVGIGLLAGVLSFGRAAGETTAPPPVDPAPADQA